METRNLSLPGYRINEYLLVLTPHEDLRNRITNIRKEFFETYKNENAIGGRPQVTLVSFTQFAMMEERLVNRLSTLAMGQTPFKLELKDFGSFPSHSIYINIFSKPAIQALVREIRKEAQRLMKLNEENKPHFIMEPHITIANKLKPWQYEKGWLEYSHKSFTAKFIADGMTLLRKTEGESRFLPVKRFEFQNMPVAIRQGELFG